MYPLGCESRIEPTGLDVVVAQPTAAAIEVSGPDADTDTGVLRFLDGPITFSWRP